MERFILLRVSFGTRLLRHRGGWMWSVQFARRVIAFCVIGRLGKLKRGMCWRFGARALTGCHKLRITMRDAGLQKCWWRESGVESFGDGKRSRTCFAHNFFSYFCLLI